jgi:predicted PurR-regulated permease PerM
MISLIFFLLIAIVLFFYVLSPFFKDFETIPKQNEEKEVEDFLESNVKEFEEDFELGKITKEELDKFEEDLKSGIENGRANQN